MKVVLANLPWKKGLKWGVRAGSRWPHIKDHTEDNYLAFPFYLAYAAGLLKKYGFDVFIIDAIAQRLSYKAFYEKICVLRPDLLVAETSTVTLRHDLNFLRQFNGQTSIALCGPDIHLSQTEFLQGAGYIDYSLFGEYEATLLELVQAMQAKSDLGKVKGIIYRADGKVIKNPPRPLIADLDWLPWPLREQLPINRYNDSPGDIPIPCASMWASRGCPFRCSFCLWPQVMYNGNKYRAREVNCVIDEMEYLTKKMGFKSVYFDDDTWNVGKERMVAFCDGLQARGVRIPWAIMARAEFMDEELLEKLHGAGLFAVKYGIESSSQQILDNVSKSLNLKRAEEVIKYTKYLGIKTHLTFTFGLPGESKETIKETMGYVLKLNPTSVQFSIATPFPGTKFYEEMEKSGYILTKNFEKFDGNHSSVIRTESLSGRELQKAKERAYRQWQMFCRLRRNKILHKKETPRQKFMATLETQGMAAAGLKVFRYMLRKLFFMPGRITRFLGKRLWIMEETISSGNLALRFGEGKIRVYWKNREISKDVGLTTSFHYGECWVDSSQANWKLEKNRENEITVKLKWDNVPVRQEWMLKIDGDAIFWSSSMQVERNVQLLECKAGIMIQDAYKRWQDDLGTGEFPRIKDWEEIELYNAYSKILKVSGEKNNKEKTLPDLELKELGKPEANTYPQIQNSDYKIKARLLQMRRLKIEQFLPGNYPYFDLEIMMKERTVSAGGVSDYKQRVPLRFIKEQVAAIGGVNVLLKIIKNLNPKRLNSYYMDIVGVLDGCYAYKGPSFAQIDLTNDCNNDCIGCWCNSPLLKDKRIKENVKKQTLPLETVKNTIGELAGAGAKEIYFAGGGEPFMHPDILKIIAHAKNMGLRCYINTNFTLVNEEIIKKLVELKVDNLVVSVWAGTPQTYWATHPNKSSEMFDQVKGMLTLLNMLKKNVPRVNIYNVISSMNFHELEEMVEFGIQTNSDSVEFTVIDTIPGATDALLLNNQQRAEVIKSCERIKRRLSEDWKDKIIIQQFEQFLRRIEEQECRGANYDKEILEDLPCYMGWLFTRILADGNVNFCLKAHRIPVGNIYAHPFSAIWNGKKQQEFRKRALCSAKEDVFFSFIGNDPDAKIGCYKTCDDLARNINMHKKIQSLTAIELYLLKAVLFFKKIQRLVKSEKISGLIKKEIEKRTMVARHKIEAGVLRLLCHGEGLKMYWKESELTQSIGFNSSICIYGLWHDSSKAAWKVKKYSDEELILENEWRDIPVSQIWRLRLKDEKCIFWQIELFVGSKLEIEECKAGLMLSTVYSRWRTEKESGRFPILMNWKEVKSGGLAGKMVAVETADLSGRVLPCLEFNFESEDNGFYPQVQNSDRLINARVISARKVYEGQKQVFLPGRYGFFSGSIKINVKDA